MFTLTINEVQSLVMKPESGMGYQIVDVVTDDYKKKRGVVYNAELLLLDEDRFSDRRLLESKSLRLAVNAASSSAGRFKAIEVVSDSRSTVLKEARNTRTTGASDAPETATATAEKFYRFSAFENDRRIRPDKSLAPGSYATPEADGATVKTGAQAVEHYALPTEDPASFRFLIAPASGTTVQRGVVQPANGHQGGGLEVIFTNGTQQNTVTLPPTKLPDK